MIAYGSLAVMVLILAAIAFHLWYNSRRRSVPRQRLREQRRYEERMAARAADQANASE